MRKVLTLTFAIFWFGLIAQISNSPKIPDCEIITHNAIQQLSEMLETNCLDSFDIVLNDWQKSCGVSECSQRLLIIKEIIDNKESINSINTYFDNRLHAVFRYRMEDSNEIDYGYRYTASKVFYGFVPLRHSIDSVVQQISGSLLEFDRLTPDEKLVCILFSGQVEEFEKELINNSTKNSYIREKLLKDYRAHVNRMLAFTFYTGVFKPMSSNDIFSYSPMIGFSISSPLRFKLTVELAFKLRLNVNDERFNYYAFGDTNFVDSKYSVFFGGLFGYKIHETKKLILLPKIGIGLEVVDTGLFEEKGNTNEKVYYNVTTFHLSLGISAMTPVFQKSYLGLGVNYHFCQYGTDKNLLSHFENNLLSAEIFLRF